MGTILAKAIIDGAAFTLQDETNTYWSRLELLSYVNDGQRDLCFVKPDAYAVTKTVPLVAGTKQALPAPSVALSRVVCNMGADGNTPGRAPRYIPMDTMDRQNPNWHGATASATVLEVTLDGEDERTFYVSPPQPASNQGKLRVVTHDTPADMANENTAITLDDHWKTALEHYVVYRAYLKEGEFNNPAGAAAHRAEFLALLGAKDKAEAEAKT